MFLVRHRSSSAAGVTFCNTNSHSISYRSRKRMKLAAKSSQNISSFKLTDTQLFTQLREKCMENSDTYYTPSKNRCDLSIHYKNEKNERKSFNDIYNDLFMRRLDYSQRFPEFVRYKSYQNIVLREMITRLQALLILEHTGRLRHKQELVITLQFFKSEFSRSRTASHFNTTYSQKWKSRFNSTQLSLLKLGCFSGEMRNHQVLCCHKDGKISSFLESLTIFG